jgi:hypothetical protein
MICLHTKFHTSNSKDLFVIAIKPKTKCRLHATAMLFKFYKKKIPQKELNIFEALLPYIISVL